MIIALHFGLVNLGQWSNDEFSLISSYRDRGWGSFSDRLFRWSPRPISEGLIWAYACLVNWTHKPLIGVFLGSLWIILLSAPLISFLQIRNNFSADTRRPLLFLSLFTFELVALFLLGHSPGTLFFWPVGAAAYLTTLSSITLCFFQVAFNLTTNHEGRVITGVSLILSAGSSETGAFFVVAFGCLSLIGVLWGGLHQRKLLWCLFPTLIAMGVFGLLIQNRARNQEAIFPTAEYHNLSLSAKAALGQTLKEYVVSGQRVSTRGLILGLLLRVCFFLGVRYCWLCSGLKAPRRAVLFVFAASVIATTYFSVTAAFYGYGGLTNPWHQELRQCLIMLVIATAGLLSCHYHMRILNIRRLEWLGAMFVFITLLIVVPPRVGPLIHDYRNYSVCIVTRETSWSSGLSDGNTMIWFTPPKGRVASTFVFLPGTYTADSKEHNDVPYMLPFFHKKRLEIRPYLTSDRLPSEGS